MFDVYSRALKHSQVGILGQEARLGSLEARHTAPFLRAVPESNISETAKCTTYRFFLDPIFESLNTPNIQKKPKVQNYCGAHMKVKTMAPRGKESSL